MSIPPTEIPPRTRIDVPAPFRVLGDHFAIGLPGAWALFTTRRGGSSTGPFKSLNLGRWTDDDPEHVRANRRAVASLVGIGAERFVQGRQVHSATVQSRTTTPEPDYEPVESDGQAVAVPDVAALVLVADCVPVVVAGEGAVVALHCGWRGLAAGIVGEGVRRLRELGAREPFGAAIGPGAGVCCYEVGDEVHAAFEHHGESVRRGRNADLKAVARAELEQAGVDRVHDVGLCTICSDPTLFFSHRRENGLTGRQAGVGWLA